MMLTRRLFSEVILEELKHLIDRYELDESSKDGVVVDANYALPESFWTNYGKSAGAESGHLRTIANAERIKKAKNWSIKRFTWVAGDKDRARELLDDLHGFNERLYWASNLGGDKVAFTTLPSKVLPQVLDTANLERLAIASTEYYPELGMCSAFKIEVLEIAKESSKSVEMKNAYRRQLTTIERKKDLEYNRSLARYKSGEQPAEMVIIEDKMYTAGLESSKADLIHKRVFEVARLLSKRPKPSGFRVLDCLGYVRDLSRTCYSFIFRLPPEFGETEPPCTLQALLESHPKPALGTRFALARTISTSILYLQACAILHKAIASRNILVFKRPGSSEYDFCSPFICGFDFSWPYGEEFKSEPIDLASSGGMYELGYAHPDYNFSDKQRFLKAYDVYSLGVILLEIALWQPLQSLGRVSARDKLREELIQKVGQLEQDVGQVYAAVVARCLTGDIKNDQVPTASITVNTDEDPSLDDTWQLMFVQNIVESLEKCFA